MMKHQVDFSSLYLQVENARENMTRKAPGKHYRDGISVFEVGGTFPDEATARAWFEDHAGRTETPTFTVPVLVLESPCQS